MTRWPRLQLLTVIDVVFYILLIQHRVVIFNFLSLSICYFSSLFVHILSNEVQTSGMQSYLVIIVIGYSPLHYGNVF